MKSRIVLAGLAFMILFSGNVQAAVTKKRAVMCALPFLHKRFHCNPEEIAAGKKWLRWVPVAVAAATLTVIAGVTAKMVYDAKKAAMQEQTAPKSIPSQPPQLRPMQPARQSAPDMPGKKHTLLPLPELKRPTLSKREIIPSISPQQDQGSGVPPLLVLEQPSPKERPKRFADVREKMLSELKEMTPEEKIAYEQRMKQVREQQKEEQQKRFEQAKQTLLMGVQFNMIDFVRSGLERGARASTYYESGPLYGKAVLDVAAEHQNPEMVRLLLQYNAIPELSEGIVTSPAIEKLIASVRRTGKVPAHALSAAGS